MQSLVEYLFRAELRGDLRFLLIGGRSLEGHGFVRNTKDVDFLITTEDISSMESLLKKVGYSKIAETTIFSRWKHSSLGAEDVDVMFVSSGTFETLYKDAVLLKVGSASIHIPSVAGIVALKLHAIKNNPDRFAKDGLDIVTLRKLNPNAVNEEDFKQLCDKYGSATLWEKLQTLNS
jgi:predicted nucleotidyltransferase